MRRRLTDYHRAPLATDGRFDGLGTYEPRPDGTAGALGWTEPPETLRRMLMQCYRDTLDDPMGQAFAHHTTKRLYEQLTGRMDADAAMRLALDYRHESELMAGRVRTVEDRDDMAMPGMVE